MKTLVIYDGIGYVYMQMTGSYRVPEGGLQYLEIEIPDGKIKKNIDTSINPNVPIYEDIPLSEIDKLKQQVTDLQNYIIEKESSDTIANL
jgi:hypothetical protein